LFVTAQGGQSTIARALKSIYDQFGNTPQWNTIRERVSRKLIVVPSGWQDNAAGTYPGDVLVADANATVTTFRVPRDAAPDQTIHLILEATDDGTPTLTRYQRVIVTVRP